MISLLVYFSGLPDKETEVNRDGAIFPRPIKPLRGRAEIQIQVPHSLLLMPQMIAFDRHKNLIIDTFLERLPRSP